MLAKVRVSLDDIRRNHIDCPYCGHSIPIVTSYKIIDSVVPIPPEKDDRGYPITQYIYRTVMDRVCDCCSKLFVIDKGVSKYNIFKTPRNCCNTGEIRLMAEFTSETSSDFSIYEARDPSDENKRIYFIQSEDDNYPIFITEEKAQEYLKDQIKTLSIISQIIMTRYR